MISDRNKAFIVDIISFAASVVLYPILLNRILPLFSGTFADNPAASASLFLVIFIVGIGYQFSLYLKWFAPSHSGMHLSSTMFWLNVPVTLFTAVFVTLFTLAFLGDLGIVEFSITGGTVNDSSMLNFLLIAMVLGLLGTQLVLLYRLSKERPAGSGNPVFAAPAMQIAADFGLFAYLMVWHGFYLFFVNTILGGLGSGISYKIFAIFIALACFTLFYIAPRSVLIKQGTNPKWTIVILILIFSISIVRNW